MVQTRSTLNGSGLVAKESNSSGPIDKTRWRLLEENGRTTWHYLTSDEEVEKWPQSIADKFFLGLPTNLPTLPPAQTPSQAIDNCLTFYSKLQLGSGNWACEYGGPHFLTPGVVITWYVTNAQVPDAFKTAMKDYLFATQNEDGGWGLHVEGDSSVFGTAMNYTVLRLCGAHEEEPNVVRARAKLHQLGGPINGPHWTKFWLSLLGVMDWDVVNPIPPEFWLLPDWAPMAPWRWWIHIRMVFLPMSYIWSKRYTHPRTPLVESLRKEMFTQPADEINFASHRNSISPADNHHPKSWLLNLINLLLVWIWIPLLRTDWLARRAEAWVWWLVQAEDANTDYADLAPVNAPLNTVVCYLEEGPDSYSVKRHHERLQDYLWVNAQGMFVNGTNGVQVWDTAFTIDACVRSGLAQNPKWKPMLEKALGFLEAQQIRDEVRDMKKCYRQSRKGAWPFSTKVQGYTVSDCTAEGLKATIALQKLHGYNTLVSEERIRDAIDVLLTMQNKHSGGFSSYELQRGSEYLELFNAAEVFSRIMVEYDYPECTTAVVTVLSLFQSVSNYRTAEISKIKKKALAYIRAAQRQDGSWYGSWGICFTYAAMFALESLKSVGETYENSERVRRGCDFLISKQKQDGGWGESYRSCEEKIYIQHEMSQVVQTAWACIALMEGGYPRRGPIKRALGLIMSRQQRNGEWLQEAIEGVFNCSCMITYPNYKFYFPVKALGMYQQTYGDDNLL